MRWNWRAPAYRFYDERLAGRNTFRYVDRLLEMQWWSPERLREFQWTELRRLLRHSFDHVPFHRERFRALGITPDDIRSPEDYARLPLLEKRDFNESADRLLADNADPERLFTNGTGGSTGEPMRYRHDRDSYEWRQAAHLRGNIWAGSGLGRKEFHLWGQPMRTPSPARAIKRRVWDFALNHRYADSYQLTAERMARYLSEFNQFRPDVMVGYSHSLYLFARFARESGQRVWSPRGIIGTAERLLPHYRETIQEVFGAPVYDRYGCREVMLIGMECEEHHGLHLPAENLYVEVVRDGRPAAPGEAGEVVVTDLHNYAMPFLRYRNGDLAVAADRACRCGRGLPLIEEMTGRSLDVLRTPGGRRISGVFVPMFFKDYVWVEEFQIEQMALDRMTVRLKPARTVGPEELQALSRDLQQRIGPDVRLDYELVERISRNASGKHRPVLSRLPGPESSEGTACRLTA